MWTHSIYIFATVLDVVLIGVTYPWLFVFIWVLIKGHFPVWLINFSEKTPVCSEDKQVKTKIMRHTIGPVLIARI